ncbi:MAG: 50S ribosomal protein L6 [Clostridiales bacterium]|jgi:large subunit ribosomal protein L6|nr:50S ribosomal protein L6 [Clostridiales bacterium]
MSRIGRHPITIPAGVTVSTENGVVTVKGPLGQLEQKIVSAHITVKIEAAVLTVERTAEDHDTKSKHGLYRALINNMVVGVTKGFSRKLIIAGVGYKATMSGTKLILNIGYSHPIEVVPPAGISFACNTLTEVEVKGISRELVGQIAAMIRAKRPVEPYHGYGLHYSDEVAIRKEGKTAGK